MHDDDLADHTIPLPSAPRALASDGMRNKRAEFLRSPHVAPINDLIDEIGRALGWNNLPYIDPTFGGVHARALLVMKAPEADADPSKMRIRFLSWDNDDVGAANIFDVFAKFGVPRSVCTPWNVCPFPIARSAPTASEVRTATPFTRRLLTLMPKLEAVVTFGAPARDAWRPAELHPGRKLTLISGASPSPPGISSAKNRASFEEAVKRLAGVLGV